MTLDTILVRSTSEYLNASTKFQMILKSMFMVSLFIKYLPVKLGSEIKLVKLKIIFIMLVHYAPLLVMITKQRVVNFYPYFFTFLFDSLIDVNVGH